MGRHISGLFVVLAVASAILVPRQARAQEFKIPVIVSPLVFRPGEDLEALEDDRGWTLGVGLSSGRADPATSAGVVQATYGGPYWYWSVGAGRWDAGQPGTAGAAFGVGYHYNMLQSHDYRTRLGVQFGWSTAGLEHARVGVLSYRAVASYTPHQAVSVYGGLGGETRRHVTDDAAVRTTSPSVLAGIQVRSGRWAVSTGFESILSDTGGLTVAGSLSVGLGR